VSKLTIGGTEIQGVTEARVKIFHNNPKAPDPVPTMEFELWIRLQNADLIGKWALAPQSADRFKKVELVIFNSDKSPAHTWTILGAYVHSHEEVEHPEGVAGGSGEGGYYLKLVCRGHMLEAADYKGDNVMTVAAGGPRALPG